MGCSSSEATKEKEKEKVKKFSDMTKEEKEEAKKLMEEQDKDLKEEINENEDPKLYEMYNWDELINKIPVQKNQVDRKKRLALWKQINEYGNGYVSFKRLNIQLEKYLKLPNVVKNKGPVKLAFNAACAINSTKGRELDDSLLEYLEFRSFLVYLRQYFEYWVMFEKVDKSGDHKISLDEFKKALSTMEKWGVKIDDPEKEFKNIDKNGEGAISFEEFCEYAIKKSLDLEEDDGFDDEELKNLK